MENIDNMPPEFRSWVEDLVDEDRFRWPSRYQMGHVFDYLYQQYETNITTNLTTHYAARLKFFFLMKIYQFNTADDPPYEYDSIDIRNAMKQLMFNQDWAGDDELRETKRDVLCNEVRRRCLNSFGNYETIADYIKHKWFESLWFFIFIQRELSIFKSDHSTLVQEWLLHKKNPRVNCKPPMPIPPKVKCFNAIPLCGFQLKHVRFDHQDLINLMGQLQLVPREIGGRPDGHSMESRRYCEVNKDAAWNILFNMAEINRLKKPNQQFHHMIVLDSVSASVLYRTPKCENTGFNKQIIKQKLEDNEYKYIIGIDPGMKTYLAGVRRNIATGVEVSN